MIDLFHEPSRLKIISWLAQKRSFTFREICNFTGMTDGNFAVHVEKLIAAGYVNKKRTEYGRQVETTFRLTPKGRRDIKKYFVELREIIGAIEKVL